MIKIISSMLFAVFCLFIPSMALAGGIDLGAMIPENLDKASVWVGLAVLVFEYLVANTKLVTSNSTIDMVISFLRNLFGLDRYEK